MSTIVRIASAKPFVEKVVQAKAPIADNITVGIAVYNEQQITALRKIFSKNVSRVKIDRWIKEIDDIAVDYSVSAEIAEEKIIALQNQIDIENDAQRAAQDDFYKSHVLFIKNASLVTNDGGVQDTKLLVQDTRTVNPIESLWADGSECLAVLLDIYLDSPFFKDSLINAVSDAIFKTDFKSEELGN